MLFDKLRAFYPTSDRHLIWIPAHVHVRLGQLVDAQHLGFVQGEVRHLEVLLDSLFRLGLGQDDKVVLKSPAQTDLGRGPLEPLGNILDDGVVQETRICPCERRVGLDGDFLLSTVIDGICFPEQRVDFELVDCRLHLRVLQEVLEMMLEEVTDSDVLHLAFLLQFDQSFPGLPPDLAVFRALDVLLADSRPVDDEQVEVVGAQSFEHLLACQFGLFVSLLSGSNFASDIELASVDVHLFDGQADVLLISVYTGRVDVSVSGHQGQLDRPLALLPPHLVRPESNSRNRPPRC
jgi:hypothetical protein